MEPAISFSTNNNDTWFLGQYLLYPILDFEGQFDEVWELFSAFEVGYYF
jgi:hypothetical protein